jgi:hypothetical protein
MSDFLTRAENWDARLYVTIAIVAAAIVGRFIILRLVRRRVDDPEIWYRAQKLSSYAGTVIVLVAIAFIWLRVSNFGAWIGLASAGIAIALSDVLRNSPVGVTSCCGGRSRSATASKSTARRGTSST